MKDPVMQNLPVPQTEEGAKVRARLIHDEVLVTADYSEVEKRLLATMDFPSPGPIPTEFEMSETWEEHEKRR